MTAEYKKKSVFKRRYKRLSDVKSERILATVQLELMANFSFIPKSQEIIRHYLEPYNIDAHDFSIHFDGATFEYYPKQLKVTVYIFENYYSFDFTKPQWLGQPLSKNTDAMLLGKAPK